MSRTDPKLITRSLCAVAATAVAPAVALAVAGTAHASWGRIQLDPWPGGLTVHITNEVRDSTWCTYTADWYQSPRFPLAAQSTYDLVIVPSVPEHRNWNVGVACDNGKTMSMTTFY